MPHPAINEVVPHVPEPFSVTVTRNGTVIGDYSGTSDCWRATTNTLAASQATAEDAYGWRPPTPYSGSDEWDYRPKLPYSYSYYSRGQLIEVANSGYALNVSTIPGAEPEWDISLKSQLEAEAHVQVLAELGGSECDLSLAFLERAKTADLVTEGAKQAYQMFRNFRKGKIPKSLKNWRNIGDLWLAWRYGVLPTMADIHGAASMIEAADNGTWHRYIRTARAKRFRFLQSESEVSTTFGAYYTIPCDRHRRWRHLQECTIRLDVTPTSDGYLLMKDVGLGNPLLTAWELTPFSFIGDWFVGVGDFLEAINAKTHYDFKGCSITHFVNTSALEYITPRNPGGAYATMEIPPTKAVKGLRAFDRVIPGPDFMVIPPLVFKRDPINFTRMSDSIALLLGIVDWHSGGRRRSVYKGLRI